MIYFMNAKDYSKKYSLSFFEYDDPKLCKIPFKFQYEFSSYEDTHDGIY